MTTACRMWLNSGDVLITAFPRAFRDTYGEHAFRVATITDNWPFARNLPYRIAIDMCCDDVLEDEYLALCNSTAQILLATIPSELGPRHWVYRRFMARPHPGCAVIRATAKDNLYLFGTPVYREALKRSGVDINGAWA